MSKNDTFDLPSNPTDRDKIAKVIKDISNQQTIIDSAKESISEAKKEMKEEFDIPVTAITKLCKLYHEQSKEEYFEAQNGLEDAYDTLFNNSGVTP